jgi:hypothetical protein
MDPRFDLRFARIDPLETRAYQRLRGELAFANLRRRFTRRQTKKVRHVILLKTGYDRYLLLRAFDGDKRDPACGGEPNRRDYAIGGVCLPPCYVM